MLRQSTCTPEIKDRLQFRALPVCKMALFCTLAIICRSGSLVLDQLANEKDGLPNAVSSEEWTKVSIINVNPLLR